MTAEPATELIEASAPAVERAARVLAAGGLVAFPTETVYGLGADATNGEAVARLYQAGPPLVQSADRPRGRSRRGTDARALRPDAGRLAAAFWPGPLTLVLPRAPGCPVAELATAGLDTIAVRMPSHPVARAILAAFRGPVVAPSANRSGHVSPTTAQHALADLRGRIDADRGWRARRRWASESTIIACLDQPLLLRPGALPRAEIERVAALAQAPDGAEPAADADMAPSAPGQLASHYAPRARLRLDAQSVQRDEALLAFGPVLVEGAEQAALTLNLSKRGDLIEAAANLFSHLRALDAAGAATIAVMPVPHAGLGEAINDRLARAAAAR